MTFGITKALRRFFLIPLIALLPLRSCAGAARAVQAALSLAAMLIDCAVSKSSDSRAPATCCDCQWCVAVADLQAPSPLILVGLAQPAREDSRAQGYAVV